MTQFTEWMKIKEACQGYALANLSQLIEGRRKPETLRNSKVNNKNNLFEPGDEDIKKSAWYKGVNDPSNDPGEDMVCPVTPLSGYEHHIKAIQQFAFQSPANFVQTLLFSPLSANVAFPKHWDNFQVLMMILKHYFPNKVTEEELNHVIDSFGEYLHMLSHTVNGWKLKTIVQIWNEKEELMHRLQGLAAEGNDEKLIQELIKIPGVQPVKAGFIVQLLFGRAGCIDTHNIDIYSKAFPDLAPELQNPKLWTNEKGVPKYVNLLNKLKDRGIGTKELWDVWVDFVENFYRQISSHKLGAYTDMGTAIDDPKHSKYDALRDIEIPKIGTTTGRKVVGIKPISGKMGRGASATHLQMEPEDALLQFDKIYNRGEPGSAAARAIPFRTDRNGNPIDKAVGLGPKPSLLKYFNPAISGDKVDLDTVRSIIKNRMQSGGKKSRHNTGQSKYQSLFGDE